MILAEKIKLLRKEKGYSQEMLAEKCKVSRQAISKWEADIALPETDKLPILSKLFQVSIDFLLIDSMEFDNIKTVHSCHANYNNNKTDSNLIKYDGVIIKESIKNELILDYVTIHKVELWKTDGTPKYWTALFFSSQEENFPQKLSQALFSKEDNLNWFADMKLDNAKIIVFKNKVLSYEIGNLLEKEKVCDECRKMGISDNEMNWDE